ncbi:MAG: tRNA(Ile)-lysidine synthase [Candidatus Marinimicrobia bacterium]|jgi:tRNA(Ile)-lysidine synthase|nr:tRNA(Ile)-lysidine synthase [Candidatus Neomarinimicrobiota bacterium]
MTEWSVLAHKVHRYITEEKLLTRGERLLVAFSGGRDSVALLYLLYELAPAWEWHLVAGHVNHGLRPGADSRESALCRHIAHDLEIPLREDKLTIPTSGNLEQTAREMRYDLLEIWAKEENCTAVVTGHHMDDQAETILYRLLKGSGLHGLQGIHPARGIIRRPLLRVSRQEIDVYCLTHGLLYAEDQSNKDESFTRNRIRYTILPYLKKTGFPAVSDHLVKLADSASLAYRVLKTYLREDLDRLFSPYPGGWYLNLDQWRTLELNRQRALLKEFFSQEDDIAHVNRETLDQLAGFLQEADKGRVFQIDNQLRMVVESDHALLTSGVDTGKKTLWKPKTKVAWTSWITLDWEKTPVPESWETNPAESYFGDDLTHIKVYIRKWKAGDRLEPMGKGKHLVSDLLKDARIPALIRPHYPVVTDGENILWVPGVRRSVHYPVPSGAASCIKLTCTLQKEIYELIEKKSDH